MLRRFCGFGAVLVIALTAAPAHAQRPVILVLGDSLSAGSGIDVEHGWVRLLQERLDREGYRYRVVNASVSGDTTAGARTRLPRALRAHRPAIVIVELGGNDGLRGLPLDDTRRNLGAVIEAAKKSGASVLLLGMRLPPNYGRAYTEGFHAIYGELAARQRIPLVPFFLDGVAGNPELMQADGVHPRTAAQPRLLANVWPTLKPLLDGG